MATFTARNFKSGQTKIGLNIDKAAKLANISVAEFANRTADKGGVGCDVGYWEFEREPEPQFYAHLYCAGVDIKKAQPGVKWELVIAKSHDISKAGEAHRFYVYDKRQARDIAARFQAKAWNF